jgi:hypothetical protein
VIQDMAAVIRDTAAVIKDTAAAIRAMAAVIQDTAAMAAIKDMPMTARDKDMLTVEATATFSGA